MIEKYCPTVGTRSSIPPSRSIALKDKLEQCLESAVYHCIESQQPNGAWETRPDPRIFENALIGFALTRTPENACAPAVERVKHWVRNAAPQNHSPVARLIEEALKSILFGRGKTIDLTAPELLTAELKSRMQLIYALALFANASVTAAVDEDTLRHWVATRFAMADKTQIKQWTKIEIAAVHILLQSRSPAPADPGLALKTLLSAQDDDGGYFRNPVASALAYLALCEVAPASKARAHCMEYLLGKQQEDGTWRFCTSDVWDTVLTMRSFHGHPLFDAISFETGAEFLKRSQNPDSGWSFLSTVESNNDTTSAAILALKDVSRAKTSLLQALRFLADYQQPDGLWRTWKFREDPPVEDVNAHVLAAIRTTLTWTRHRIPDSAARHWLQKRFETNGRWAASWYRGTPYAVSEVTEGLGTSDPHVRQAIAELERSQNPDGGWGQEFGKPSVPSATGLALGTLLKFRDIDHSLPAQQGLKFLLDTQGADGLWQGVPEMYGPRPLLSHYQTHTQAFAVTGILKSWRQLNRLDYPAKPIG